MSRPQGLNNNVTRLCVLLSVLVLAATSLCAQSLDPNAPTPVRTNNVNGIIAARDLGDARLTDHYYAFTGTPGDLLITVQSQNLNGDIDVFTAGTLRPLFKLTLYAESSVPVTKSIYLRRREDLVLRVEARSPNDDEGSYRLHFGGSFEPIIGGPDIAENETPAVPKTETPATGRKTTRVNSAGARIAEPEPPPAEVATAPTPEPPPEPTPEAKPAESPKRAAEKPAEDVRPTPRNPRTPRRPTPRRTTPRNTETARAPVEKPKPEPKPETQPEARPEPPPEIGPRLVIETTDGTLINRPMSGIRRVTVENGQVVVVGRDGKISRFLLADVVRMSIAP
jgi:pyruvate/2-oxoglutarate dehydrogenase complex dihydrolipoamide acyltransferase (E2) component